ncbi:cupin [Caproiciproducens sp.]
MPNSIMEKPWGTEELIAQNDHYIIRKLTIRTGQAVSLQYHKEKIETLYVLSGTATYYRQRPGEEMTETVVGPGDIIENHPYELHRERAIEDFVFIEVSTPQMEDIVRVEDDYGRI